MQWNQKTVIVTGGGSGIGRATSLSFADQGANVVVVDKATLTGEETVELIYNKGGSAIYIQTDVIVESDVERMVGQTIDQFRRIDVLVNNAAICPQVKLTDMTLLQWNEVINTNLTSVFLGSRAVIPHMLRTGGGAIVNVSSVHALATIGGYSAYSASKGGVVALTRAIALDYAKQNIRVNAVLPGAIHTPLLEASIQDLSIEEVMQSWNDAQPVGRVGQPQEIAAVILFAASKENSFMTGAALVADGGMTIEL